MSRWKIPHCTALISVSLIEFYIFFFVMEEGINYLQLNYKVVLASRKSFSRLQ